MVGGKAASCTDTAFPWLRRGSAGMTEGANAPGILYVMRTGFGNTERH